MIDEPVTGVKVDSRYERQKEHIPASDRTIIDASLGKDPPC